MNRTNCGGYKSVGINRTIAIECSVCEANPVTQQERSVVHS
jgi:hypothetical protein